MYLRNRTEPAVNVENSEFADCMW